MPTHQLRKINPQEPVQQLQRHIPTQANLELELTEYLHQLYQRGINPDEVPFTPIPADGLPPQMRAQAAMLGFYAWLDAVQAYAEAA